jgi:serine/threonine-protein kinase RsbW
MKNRMEEIDNLATLVEQVCADLKIDAKTESMLNLALEEAVVNVINYAYPEGVCEDIRLTVENKGEELIFVLSDKGVPFDPTKKPDTDVNKPAGERQIGGLGIFLVRKIMDSISYQYSNNRNELTMIKNIHQ